MKRLSPMSESNSVVVDLDREIDRVSMSTSGAVKRIAGTEASFMAGPQALSALAALGQSTRLEIFHLLMRHEPAGLNAGSIAARIGCPQNTLSSHISILARAGLVQGTRDGRSINYRADVEGMRRLLGFLVTDCCGGHPELCGFLENPDPDSGQSGSKASCGCGQ